ncbi:MAG: hypothetical protein AMS18_06720 [Gemmatimonas sp. SG8_17]|nr:MAG: hypothetical protein AMS18_06720 [Gemmatimonas sp. SG8_17]
MTATVLKRVLVRDLEALRDEILAYPNDDYLWACPPGITNSAGTLTLHLTGNLNFYVGAQLGGTGYARDRDAEFSNRNLSRVELVARIEQAVAAVGRTLDTLDDGTLEGEYPAAVAGIHLSVHQFLTHLATHLAYHLGQVDYHRRIVTAQSHAVDAQSIQRLVDL